jgi:bifunctional N-acetylglucosamine-1-phosphate-uridyltransferase/glucosamine-1-phosphate-acetyltransferase GlmU-like protein
MKRVLVIPAAGAGSRLGARVPKVMVAVAGRPMLLHLFDLYHELVARIVVIVAPAAFDMIRRLLSAVRPDTDLVTQETPSGMLDAILLARASVVREPPDRVWITWCDQVAVHPATLAQLAALEAQDPTVDLIFPTSQRPDPYIHFTRDRAGQISGVLHRREGDAMPETGESDIGLFSLSRTAYEHALADYADTAVTGRSTCERNFLPFIPWLAARGLVRTFPCTEAIEAIGINTPDDLHRVEQAVRERGMSGRRGSGRP